MTSWCKDVLLLLVCLGVAAALSQFQLGKFNKHFDLADANDDGILTLDDYNLIANRTGYKKYPYDTFHLVIVPQAWSAFPNQTLTRAQYLAGVGVDLQTSEGKTALEHRVRLLAPIMFDIWNSIAYTKDVLDKNELHDEFAALQNNPNVGGQTDTAFNAMATNGGISRESYVNTAVGYFLSDVATSPTRFFFGDVGTNYATK